ncbi:MAG: glycosyltransferase family 4 protein [candidate division KSB1 bacterium]|nr:glycosyltransferase family 4 protein [candidate division KSB1 bacterium]MDZ7286772.1 glycosyltransferase family 4 protein [candidate division KSB1 bacterium]MDZ7299871.1 glycosyltransferase family 4 protein [candidate division KSB1 bacterium]MDZ7383763.1 glycosyltransferase family 4 protein [candidate division KSB1 bacterium]MDZ7397363.1 glycosyltransferase family 4 protein [candidate division KSB1 bacterium]
MVPPVAIVYLTDKLTHGGTPLQIIELVLHLDRRQFQPHVIALSQADPELRERLQHAGIAVCVIGQANWVQPRALPAAHRLYRSLRRLRPRIVHAFLATSNVLGGLLGKLAGVPVLITSHRDLGGFDGVHITRLNDWVDRHLATAVTANSLAVRAAVAQRSGRQPETITLLYNGIDVARIAGAADRTAKRRELDLPPQALVIGVVANLRPAKGHRYLLQAFARIADRFPEALLLLCGQEAQNGQLQELQNLAVACGIGGRVRFLGARRDIDAVLHTLDILVSPSLSEGFSNAILEAMAAGLPVIATRVGGSPEQVVDGVTGLLVAPAQVTELQQALLTLLASPALRAQMGKAARARVCECFSVAVMAANHARLYHDLLREKS